MSAQFQPPKVYLEIGSKDDTSLKIKAQYNPKELQIDQTIPWKKPEAANQTGTQKSGGEGENDPIALEFTGAEGRSMTVELLFDGFGDAGGRTVDVAGEVGILEALARVRNPQEKDEKKRRPHQCIVLWGKGLPSFLCVIESLSTKYTMFSPEGEPLRATCTVKLKEAHAVDKKEKAKAK